MQRNNRKWKNRLAAVGLGAVLTAGAAGMVAVGGPGLVGAQGADGADATATGTDEPTGGRFGRGAFVEDALAPLVADGTLTPAQADAVEAALREQREARRAELAERRDEIIAAAAAFLGVTPDEVAEAWRAGDSLAEMAEAAGRSRDELLAAIVAAIESRADAALDAGRITAEQAADIEQRAPELAERFADAERGDRHPRLAARLSGD